MTKTFVNKIITTKVRRFKKNKEKNWRKGVLASGTFYDLTGEFDSMNKNIKKKIEKISGKIKDSDGKTTHFIVSLRDMEKLNFGK